MMNTATQIERIQKAKEMLSEAFELLNDVSNDSNFNNWGAPEVEEALGFIDEAFDATSRAGNKLARNQ